LRLLPATVSGMFKSHSAALKILTLGKPEDELEVITTSIS